VTEGRPLVRSPLGASPGRPGVCRRVFAVVLMLCHRAGQPAAGPASIARTVAALMTLAGCTGAADGGHAATATPTAFPTRAAAPVGGPASTTPGSPTARRTTAPPSVRGTVLLMPPPTNQAPVIRSISSVPEQVNPLGCTPPDPPERPEITISLEVPDESIDPSQVWLQYHSSDTHRGEVRMRFDAKRQVFVATLPPVTRVAVGDKARDISVNVRVPPSIRRPSLPTFDLCQGVLPGHHRQRIAWCTAHPKIGCVGSRNVGKVRWHEGQASMAKGPISVANLKRITAVEADRRTARPTRPCRNRRAGT
jgi:hypothetical protein